MRKAAGLTVIECKYCYNKWRVDCSGGTPVFTSELKEFQQPREVDLYHACGAYSAMGVPVEIHNVDYENYSQYAPYAGVTRDYSDAVYSALSQGRAVLAAGGYCNYAPAILGGLQRALGADRRIGVVWIDAHADCRVPETSPEPVRLVGVPLSTMAGLTLPVYRREVCGLETPCRGEDILASDLRMMDETTAENLCAANITPVDGSIFESEALWREKVSALAERVDAIYLSVDADILKPDYVPAYEKRVPLGHDLDVVARNVQVVMETGKVGAYSLFCFDFDHYEQGGERTYASGKTLVTAGLERWSMIP